MKAHGVVMAMPQGQSWAPTPSIGVWRTWELSNVALVSCVQRGNGQVRCLLMALGRAEVA